MTPALPNLMHEPWLKTPGLQKLFSAIDAAGGEARVVGGAVRNALLGVPVADIDIATDLTSLEVLKICTAHGFACHETGMEHGTVTVVIDHHPYEVTTLRRDIATDGRHATVEFTNDWREDALRRDFTMNALYCDRDGKLYDYTNGYADIVKRKVRFVGTASRRIREDYLRVLRFFRFHAYYGKGQPDAEGLMACTRARRNIAKLSVERVTQELLKLLAAPNPVPVLKVIAAHDILPRIIPHTEEWHTLARLPADEILRLSVLARSIGDVRRKLRLSNLQLNRLQALEQPIKISPNDLAAHHRQLLYLIGAQTFIDAAHVSLANSDAPMDDVAWQELISFPSRWQAPKFPVNGQDLKSLGWASGPALGKSLAELECQWIESDFTLDRNQLLSRATQLKEAP